MATATLRCASRPDVRHVNATHVFADECPSSAYRPVTVDRVHNRDLQCIKFAAGSFQHSCERGSLMGGQKLVIGGENFVQCLIQDGRRFHRDIVPVETRVR